MPLERSDAFWDDVFDNVPLAAKSRFETLSPSLSLSRRLIEDRSPASFCAEESKPDSERVSGISRRSARRRAPSARLQRRSAFHPPAGNLRREARYSWKCMVTACARLGDGTPARKQESAGRFVCGFNL